jgi:hypothetical protein
MFRLRRFFSNSSISAILFTATNLVFAEDITTCKDPTGMAYYHHANIIRKKDSGWGKDKISDGRLTLKKIADGEYDILIYDATKTLFSLKQDGGQIVLMRAGENDATFLHFYPDRVIELYTFWKDSLGQFKYDLIQSKGGDLTLAHKSSILVGSCSAINFEIIK